MTEPIRTLIISSPGRLRASLGVLVRASQEFDLIGQADTSLSGLEMVVRERPDLVLLDSRLPGEAAWSLLSVLKRNYPEVACWMLVVTSQDEAHAQAAGADEALTPGLTVDNLIQLARKKREGDGL
jgi:DNA-binding NarL/FixJ family response regulator